LKLLYKELCLSFMGIPNFFNRLAMPRLFNMRMTKYIVFIVLILVFPLTALAEKPKESTKLEEDFAEMALEDLLGTEVVLIDVFGSHTHFEDEWMVGYHYMRMDMVGNRKGSNQLSKAEVLNDFNVAPLNMSTAMHMMMLMYAPSDELTLMAMVPYIEKAMDHENSSGVRFTTRSDGIGDLTLKGTYTLYQKEDYSHRLLAQGGLTVPTGSIDEKDVLANPANGEQKLPYPMQLGSGTVDLLPGLTYLGEGDKFAWGTEWRSVLRIGRNSNGYSLGDQHWLSTWLDYKLTDAISPYLRFDGQVWGDVDGSDPELNQALVPTARPDLRAGERIDAIVGINYYASKGFLKGHRFGIKGGLPVYQRLDGPQLEVDSLFSVGWTYTW
jgi:hypothetical protein